MKIRVATFGRLPRDPVPNGVPDTRALRRKFERGEISQIIYQQALNEHARAIFLEQEQMGIDFPSEGWFVWDDPYNGTLVNVGGFAGGRLAQNETTNTLFERPVAVSFLEWHCNGQSECHRLEKLIGREIPIIPYRVGPLTLATKTESLVHGSKASFAFDLAEQLREELRWLLVNPWPFVRVVETTSFINRNAWWGFNTLDAVRTLLKDIDTSKILFCLDRAHTELLYLLLKLPVGALGINFADSDIPFEILENFPPDCTLFAGVVSGTICKRETADQVAAVVEKILDYVPAERLVLTSGGNLYVSRSDAIAKMQTLVSIAEYLGGGS